MILCNGFFLHYFVCLIHLEMINSLKFSADNTAFYPPDEKEYIYLNFNKLANKYLANQ